MQEVENNINIKTPLLNSLYDENPEQNNETRESKYLNPEQLQNDIKENLETLLNSRNPGLVWSNQYEEISGSVLNFGIIDFMQNNFSNKEAQIELCRNIEVIIRNFEPRLQGINVSLVDNDVSIERLLKIRIEANINIMPTSIPAVFESQLDINNNSFHIR